MCWPPLSSPRCESGAWQLPREAAARSEPVAPSPSHVGGRLSRQFPVAELGLSTATDNEIWDHARDHSFVVVSTDSDFRQLAFLLGPPPKAIWLRVGNATTLVVLDVIRQHHEAIAEFAANDQEALLVLPSAL